MRDYQEKHYKCKDLKDLIELKRIIRPGASIGETNYYKVMVLNTVISRGIDAGSANVLSISYYYYNNLIFTNRPFINGIRYIRYNYLESDFLFLYDFNNNIQRTLWI